MHGIGEKFSPDLFTGTGNFTIPIALPPDRGGFQADFNLVYSTGTGNGPFGLGWTVNGPGVTRKTSRGVPLYDDDRDVFLLSNAEDLVPVAGSAAVRQYRPRTEGVFADIVHVHDPARRDDYWRVRGKDGRVAFYGTPGASGQDPATLADPANLQKIFAWRLTETRDPFGNRIVYDYVHDQGEQWDQIYLKRMRSLEYTEGGSERFLVSVTLDYGEPDEERPDIFSEYRAGFEIRTRWRCHAMVIQTHPNREERARYYSLTPDDPHLPDAIPARSYSFVYSNDAANGVSLLREIRVEGYGRDAQEELPPLTFGYSQFAPEKRRFTALEGPLPTNVLGSPDLELADLTGNGLPDILQMNGIVRFWQNLGNGWFAAPRVMQDAPGGLGLADPGVQLLDGDGDGRIDVLVTRNRLAGYFPLQHDGQWDARSFHPYTVAPSFNLEDPEVRLVDLNGDGVTDAMRSGARLECYFNDPDLGWQGPRIAERCGPDALPEFRFSDPHVKWADMSGDGLLDILLVRSGSVEYWPNLGHGRWGSRVPMRGSPHFPLDYDPRRVLVGDVDGDGLADLVYVDDHQVSLWMNQGGRGWNAEIAIEGTPAVSNVDAVRLVDLLGTGVAGVLWAGQVREPGRPHAFFLDFTGGSKPYLLNEMDNHMGATTRVAYAPSTHFYLADACLPTTRWHTPLPFPVQVVARVEAIDHISQGKLTTTYRYHDGYWDGVEREFRGFGMVEQIDTETFEAYNGQGLHGDNAAFRAVTDQQHFAPPLLTKTWFHLGPVDDGSGEWHEPDRTAAYWPEDPPLLNHAGQIEAFLRTLPDRSTRRDALRALRGSILRTELYALDERPEAARPYTVTEHTYGLRDVDPAAAGERRKHVFFPHRLVTRTTQWERGDDPLTQVSFSDDYDAYGHPCQGTTMALPRRQARRLPMAGAVVGTLPGDQVNETRMLATHSRTRYAEPDPGLYLHDCPAATWSFEFAQPPGMKESASENLGQVLRDQIAAAIAVHTEFRRTLQNWTPDASLPPDVRLLSHTINHYDGAACTGRPMGQVGPYGALVRSAALAFRSAELDAAYDERRPAYLGGSASLPPGAPPDFSANAGYRLEAGGASGYQAGYYVDTLRQAFDFQDAGLGQRRGLVVAIEDALGHRTSIQPDSHWLLPQRVIDPAGLATTAEYDYRVLQPTRVIDANRNAICYRYTPLGLLRQLVLQGRDGEGGSQDRPEVEYTYDFLAWERSCAGNLPQPVYAHTRRQVHHSAEGISDETIEIREYSDGFGRLIQTRGQAEELAFGQTGDDVGLPLTAGSNPGPVVGQRVADRMVVSGWQVYDNKGRVIEKYEPFFARSWDYQPEAEARRGQHQTLFYDPRGHVIRTVNSDGSEQRLIFGIPPDLRDPTRFVPTPWESYAYDANDLAPLSPHPTGTPPAVPPAHHYTPASVVLDGLGRSLCQIIRNGPKPEEDWHITRSAYDIRGNLLQITDALGRAALRHAYDLLNRPLRVESIDAGLRTSVHDAGGNLIEYRDGKGSIALRQYDRLNRLVGLWACDGSGRPMTRREALIYGDDRIRSGLDEATAIARNLQGRLYRHYDEAGLQTFERYDFKGNLLEKARLVISDAAMAAGWVADWSIAGAETTLDSTRYQTSTTYDALNRPVTITYPADVTGQRAVLTPHYNRAGLLEQVDLDGAHYVAHIAYNVRGQRVLLAYGNGLMTRYAYAPDTFRLVRLRSERFSNAAPSPDTWAGVGLPLQDLTYEYDLVGNITGIEDQTPDSGIAGSSQGRDRLLRTFEYDPLYRLVRAEGRACRDIGAPRHLDDLARCGAYPAPYSGGPSVPNQHNAPELTERYTETYRYDPPGNLLELSYTTTSGTWTRRFGMGGLPPEKWAAAPNNRLTSLIQGAEVHSFAYDENGNMTGQNTEQHYTWDHADRLAGFTICPASSSQASIEARYLYGADGIRVKKWVRTGGTGAGKSTVYINGIFEHHRWQQGGQPGQNNWLHVMDGEQRIALVRRGPTHPDDAGPGVQYHLGDHLGSSSLVADATGMWINSEEYFPYGETSLGSFARKRYRFTGKERDEESGLNYHGARYYAPAFVRWLSCDDVGVAVAPNLYIYALDNPLRLVDADGRQPSPPQYPVPVAGSTPFNFIAEGPALENWNKAVYQVLEPQFQGGSLKADLDIYKRYIQGLPSGPRKLAGTAQWTADAYYSRVRTTFYKLEADFPSFTYSSQESALLRSGYAPRPGMQLHHATHIHNEPWRSLDPEIIMYSEGGAGGGLSRGSPHYEVHYGPGAKRLNRFLRQRAISERTSFAVRTFPRMAAEMAFYGYLAAEGEMFLRAALGDVEAKREQLGAWHFSRQDQDRLEQIDQMRKLEVVRQAEDVADRDYARRLGIPYEDLLERRRIETLLQNGNCQPLPTWDVPHVGYRMP